MSDPRPPLPPPPQPNWYPNHFQYQPPPPQSTWPPHNPSDHHHHHQPTSYPPPQQSQNHYYPSFSHPSQPQSYPQPHTNQAWANPNPNWDHRQVYPDRSNPINNGDDLAAKARAWSAAKTAMESQHQPPQLTHISRPEEHNRGYHDEYQPTGNPHYANFQQPSLPASSHQQFSVPMGDTHGVPPTQLQDSSSFSSGSSSYYVSDLQASYASRDGALGADPPVYPHQGNIQTNSSGYAQEVPSSYSSLPGERNRDAIYTPSLPISSGYETQHYGQPNGQPTHAAPIRSAHEEQPYFSYGVGSSGSVADPSDRPLDFAPGFNSNPESHDQHPHSGYMHPEPAGPVGYVDHVSAGSSISALTPPVIPGMGYPPSGMQYDPSYVSPAPVFGQMTGPNFPPNIPTVSAAFGLGATNILPPVSSFPGDFNGLAGVPDKPKKASVPNWLREEIIKNKAVIASSFQERLEEDPDNNTEDDNIEKSFEKRGPADGRSIDSPRSPDDEDNDEDAIEAARTAAINQEIKRVLTEVLLKVTDDLFDEIATKVLNEDDQSVEVEHSNALQKQSVSQSIPSVPAPKASAKVLIPVKTKGAETDDAIGKSPSKSAGDLLGLGNYASDDDDFDETESYSKSTKDTKGSEDMHHENGNSKPKIEGPSGINIDKIHDKPMAVDKEMINNVLNKNLNHENKGNTLTSANDSLQANQPKSGKSQDVETKGNNLIKELVSEEPRREERHGRRERGEDRNGTKERPKDRVSKSEEKVRESDIRKSSHSKDDKMENEKTKKDSFKDDNGRRRTRDRDEKEEKSRHHAGRDSSSHRRRHSEDSDESSEDSRRRKRHSRRRSLSPSPTRSKKRQVSRSPHSKHSSHRRQSPYSSLDTKRGRRSRSRSKSPVRRRR